MILADVNVLLYAHDRGSPCHLSAKEWLENALDRDQVFLSWHTITGFLRIATHPAIFTSPFPIDVAVRIVTSWLENDNVHVINIDKSSWPVLADLLVDTKCSGNLVMDAHLAALALTHGLRVVSTDNDFSRFPVKTLDPLTS
jgi:toxin-antitoxin system PIN domain toxin